MRIFVVLVMVVDEVVLRDLHLFLFEIVLIPFGLQREIVHRKRRITGDRFLDRQKRRQAALHQLVDAFGGVGLQQNQTVTSAEESIAKRFSKKRKAR